MESGGVRRNKRELDQQVKKGRRWAGRSERPWGDGERAGRWGKDGEVGRQERGRRGGTEMLWEGGGEEDARKQAGTGGEQGKAGVRSGAKGQVKGRLKQKERLEEGVFMHTLQTGFPHPSGKTRALHARSPPAPGVEPTPGLQSRCCVPARWCQKGPPRVHLPLECIHLVPKSLVLPSSVSQAGGGGCWRGHLGASVRGRSQRWPVSQACQGG